MGIHINGMQKFIIIAMLPLVANRRQVKAFTIAVVRGLGRQIQTRTIKQLSWVGISITL
jgi:hypothetical protein